MPDDATLFPKPLHHFLELYKAGRFWDSHEVLEDEWRRTGSDIYQALILYASAWVHWQRGNAHGVRAQLSKALERFVCYPDSYLGLDIAALRDHCREARDQTGQNPHTWRGCVNPLPISLSVDRLRGDEMELRD